MSYLSTTENVGFSGIPQNMSDASCATQYKMAVEGVSGNCADVNMYMQDCSGDEQTYITHLNDNFFQNKFKIDPNELYTFHDSDVIANEITVGHTEDNFIFADSDKSKFLESPNKELDVISSITNGEIKEEKEVIVNGHYPPITKSLTVDKYKKLSISSQDNKTTNTKVPKVKSQSHGKEQIRSNSVTETRRPSVHSPRRPSDATSGTKNSITSNSQNTSSSNAGSTSKSSAMETFLDVFKREQGLVENATIVKTELPSPPGLPSKSQSVAKKTPTVKGQSKAKRGRGPAVHEALQRIPGASQRRVEPRANRTWHAPGHELDECGPLDARPPPPLPFTRLDTSSSDDDMPDFDDSPTAEECGAESRGARLATRRAALRRHVAQAREALRYTDDFREQRQMALLLKKHLRRGGARARVPPCTVNYVVSRHGMPSLLTAAERRSLRARGWSGSGSSPAPSSSCCEERCTAQALPAARQCLTHVTRAPTQRLYAACAAVFAGGARCMQPLLPLEGSSSGVAALCAEHAWKRDNYDKLSRDARPKKPVAPGGGASGGVPRARPAPRAPRRPRRRRRPPPTRAKLPPPHVTVSEVSVCSNSSAYDSEEAAAAALSDVEYLPAHGLEVEVGQVPADDILDPAVLSQIPDEAFTEFFNQSEGSTAFAESSELAAALEAVLDERALDSIAAMDALATHPHTHHGDTSGARVGDHAVERVVITQ